MASTTIFSGPIYPVSSIKSQQPKYPVFVLRASSSPSSVEKQEDEESSSSSTSSQSQPISSIPFGGCQACGKSEVERGCNGEGRMQGGIATVPGFGWWPIKAYRPCPSFVATGGRYRRQGQSMDEVAGFGSVPRIGPVTATTTAAAAPAAGETQSSEKKQGPRKFKR
ncbi:lin-54 family [Artemisia annua]|uniref:Lin-54 family n=1 Tax=Artemisia annua TaxID=35608 RepID=A0A2U1KGK8_ARTAN|nr:lin-54 family [Artemisia annua]